LSSAHRAGEDLLDSVLVHLHGGIHIKRAAGQLFVHPNTLRYRIARFETLADATSGISRPRSRSGGRLSGVLRERDRVSITIVFSASTHPMVRRLWISFGLTLIGVVALALLGDWFLALAAVLLLAFNARTIRSVNRKLAAYEQSTRDET
jgi:ABC-type multidrug transport system fused ATPase/permease subunit